MCAPLCVTAELRILLLFCYVNDVNKQLYRFARGFVLRTLIYLHQGALDGGRLGTVLKMWNQTSSI